MEAISLIASGSGIVLTIWGVVNFFRPGKRFRGGLMFLSGLLVLSFGVGLVDREAAPAYLFFCFAAVVWSIIMLFKKGQRLVGVVLAPTAILGAVLLVASANLISNANAREAGFASWADQITAQNAGFRDAETWSEVKSLRSIIESGTDAEVATAQARLDTLEQAVADERAEAFRLAEERAEAARREIAEQERLAAEQERIAAERAEQERLAQEAAALEEQRSGLHCLSEWDGSHPRLARAVIDSLNNPRSFEHVETLIWKMSEDGTHRLLMNFRAANAFGGIVRNRAIAKIRNSDCAVLEWQTDW